VRRKGGEMSEKGSKRTVKGKRKIKSKIIEKLGK
jgi:hypothetical protein